jgi:transposase
MDQTLCPGCRERDACIAALEAQCRAGDARVVALEKRVAELEGRLNDLTKPPLPPRPGAALPKAPARKPSGKKPGGQPGHPPHLKAVLPPERVNRTVAYVPHACAHCHTPLPKEAGPEDPPPTRHQVAELPEMAAHITEHQGHARTCPCCGKITWATIPDQVRAHSIGPHLTAVLSYFAGCHGVSKRGVEEICEAVFDAPIALGTVANLEQEMSAALASAHEEAVAAVRQAPVKYVDETGWKQAGHKRWLWVAATNTVVAFVIDLFRNVTALRKLLGPTLSGIVCSDRWRAYDYVELLRRQVCWAHLKRNWEKMQKRGGKAKSVADDCLSVQQRVFEQWHLFRGGGCSRVQMDDAMAPLMLEMAAILQQGLRCRDRKIKRFCGRVLDVYPAMWTFVVVEGVEPTNNHAERVQRRAVLWRRRSFGCHSASGCRFVERILTVVQTLRLQRRSVLRYLKAALIAHRAGTSTPSLLSLG